MAGFNNLREITEAYEEGRSSVYTFKKGPMGFILGNAWFDLSTQQGMPVGQMYSEGAEKTSTLLSPMYGAGVGGAVSPRSKFLARCMGWSNSIIQELILCDYLLYYPRVNTLVSGTTALVNSTPLPRYASGDGVMILPVLTSPQISNINSQSFAGVSSFSVSYTNQAGVPGRITAPIIPFNTWAYIGNVPLPNTFNHTAPFMSLQAGDTGVRSIESIIVNGADSAHYALVLVKPIASFMLRGLDAPVEVNFLTDRPSLPRIYDGAVLNFLLLSISSQQGNIMHGEIETVVSRASYDVPATLTGIE